MKNITMADIARRTGYSINTVSHALHDKSDISARTKEFIVKTAKEMGYIANMAASSLRSGKTRSIAIIVGDISNPHFSIIIKEMEGQLRKRGYNAFILNTDEDEKLEHAAITSAISKNVDGILLCPVQKSRSNLDYIVENDIPCVLFGRRFENSPLGYVICDDFNGGYLAAQHLLHLQHKKLLFINAPLYISSSRERLAGIQQAMVDLAIPQESLQIAETAASGHDASLISILKAHDDCTGIICFSDLLALGVCHSLKQLGKNVPEDVSVLGFDNIVSKFSFPLMLTSVTSSKTKVSTRSVDALMELLEKPDASPCRLVLPTKLIERESTKKI